jgi:hypothetical protein
VDKKLIKFFPLKKFKSKWGGHGIRKNKYYWKDGYYKVKCRCGCGKKIDIYLPTYGGGIFDNDMEIGGVLINMKDMKKMLERITEK